MFAEHDEGGFGVAARRLGIGVVGDVEFAVLVLLQGSGVLLLRRSPCVLDGDEFGPRGKLPVDMRRHLGLKTWRVKALVALHIREQAGVETAATRARDASSGLGFEGRVFAVERSFGKVQVEVGLNPCAQVLGRKQVRFLVLPVLPPAVFKRLGLMLLRKTGDQVGVARRDALLSQNEAYLRSLAKTLLFCTSLQESRTPPAILRGNIRLGALSPIDLTPLLVRWRGDVLSAGLRPTVHLKELMTEKWLGFCDVPQAKAISI